MIGLICVLTRFTTYARYILFSFLISKRQKSSFCISLQQPCTDLDLAPVHGLAHRLVRLAHVAVGHLTIGNWRITFTCITNGC